MRHPFGYITKVITGHSMRYRLLGTLEIGDAAAPVALGGPRQTKIMAALLLRANQVVTIGHLIEVLWDDGPPAQAVKVARNCVSLLRAALLRAEDSAVLHTVAVGAGGGYRLTVAEDELDLSVFHRQCAEADHLAAANQLAQAADRLRDALELWRGPALHGLHSAALAPQLARLQEQHLTWWERYADLRLQLGQPEHIITALTEFTALHPSRERLHAQLMLALHRAARRTDALAVYRDLHHHLRTELGIDPDPAVTDLQQRILANDRALTPAGRTPTLWSPPSPSVAPQPSHQPRETLADQPDDHEHATNGVPVLPETPAWPPVPAVDGADPEAAGCRPDAVTSHVRRMPINNGRLVLGQVELRYSPSRRAAWGRFAGLPTLDHLAGRHRTEIIVEICRDIDGASLPYRAEYCFDNHFSDILLTDGASVWARALILLDDQIVAEGETARVCFD